MSQTRNRRRRAKKSLAKLDKRTPKLGAALEALSELQSLEQLQPVLDELSMAVALLIKDHGEQQQELARLRFVVTRLFMEMYPGRALQIPALVKRYEREYDQTNAPSVQTTQDETPDEAGSLDQVDAGGDSGSQGPQ